MKTRARARAAAALALTWLLAGLILIGVRATKPSQESVMAYLRASATTHSQRGFVAGLAARMNRLTFGEREAVKHSEDYRAVYQGLPPAEKARYLTATVPTDLPQMLDALAAMPEASRRACLDEAAQQTDSNNFDLSHNRIAKERTRRMGEDALRHYFEEADPATKESLLPILDQAERYLWMW